jgi:hypothetical protein
VTHEELLALVRTYEGNPRDRHRQALSRRRFAGRRLPYFIPESSGLGQTNGRKATERFLTRYNETHSLRPKD